MTLRPGFTVYTSHRLEDLTLVLAEVLASAPLPPLATETIVVPGQGLAHWLRLQLAERHGIAAGLELPFPGAFLQRLAHAGEPGVDDPWTPEALTWRIWRLLGDPAQHSELGPAAAYCRDDPDGQKRLQLCQRLAACFDDYQLYRDDLLVGFARGETPKDLGPHAAWQGALWRALLRDAGTAAEPPPQRRRSSAGRKGDATPLLFRELADAPAPPVVGPGVAAAHRLAALRQLLADPARARAALPPRLSVFGAGTLPPAFLALLQQIAEHVPVALYAPTPSPHFLGEERGRDQEQIAHPLLARLGVEAREFGDRLLDLDEHGLPFDLVPLDAGANAPAEPRDLLQCVQQDLVAIAARGAAGGPPRFALRADDASLRVHDCHSPMRELEVVRDQILAAFAADATLQPHEMLVLVPDVATYAPFAHAVFGPVAEHLPFQVADRDPAAELPLCAALLALLQLAQDRLHVHDVLHVLEHPAVQRRFGIGAADLPVLQHRCAAAGIRWGLDGAMRERQFRVPAFEENSWRQGLERLVLGMATGPVDALVGGVLPVADVTDGRTDLLTRFCWFVETLFAHLSPLQRPQPLPAWADRLDALLRDLFDPASEDAAAVAYLQQVTADLRALAGLCKVTDPVGPAVARAWLQRSLQRATGARGFFGGGVTIAALLPLRMVPVRHLFVCGLGDQSFPRRDQPAPFDLAAVRRRPGDRSVRLDDRQMFLDALLAARERLHVTFVGRSAKDDSPCAPSVVLSELLDHLDRTCRHWLPDTAPQRAVVVQHPLQAWSPRYRDGRDPRLFTFARHDLRGVARASGDAPPWIPGEVAPPLAFAGDEVPLARLEEFWKSPCRFFLQHTMALRVRASDDSETDTEPFQMNKLDEWRIKDAIVARAERGDPPPADPLALARASGQLPVGGLGTCAYWPLADDAQTFVATVAAFGPRRAVAVVATAGAGTVRGELSGVTGDRIVHARIAALKPKDVLRGWIEHVVAAVARAQGAADLPARTIVLGKDAAFAFRELAPDVAQRQLDVLLRGFRDGLRAPLPFFPETSDTYVLSQAKGEPDALTKARRKWLPSDGQQVSSESEEPANELCMRDRDPFALPGFATWADAVFGAIHQHGDKEKA